MMVPLKDKKVESEEVQGFQSGSATPCRALKGLVVCRTPNVTNEVKTIATQGVLRVAVANTLSAVVQVRPIIARSGKRIPVTRQWAAAPTEYQV
jgi:hypothetical protein